MPPTPNPDHVHAVLDELVPPLVDRLDLAGLSVGVVDDGRLVAARGYGFADLAGRRPADASTVYRIGSISKTFTGIAAMQLVEQGLIDLDDPVQAHLRAFRWVQPRGTRPATIRDVMTHTAGVGEVQRRRHLLARSVIGLGVPAGRPVPPLASYYSGRLRTDIGPGQKWAYGNHAIAALGQVVEDVSGVPFERYAREHVFAPLGMGRTDFVLQPAHRPHLATGYRRTGTRPRETRWHEVAVRPAGSAFSSVEQIAMYAAALMHGGANRHGRVLAPGTLAQMYVPHWRRHPALPGQGLTFLLDDYDGHRVVWHTGGWPGFTSALLVAPHARLAVAAFTNSGAGTLALADRVLRRLLGVPLVRSAEDRRRAPDAPQLWPQLVGVYTPSPGGTTNYRLAPLGLEIDVVVRGGHLVARSPLGALRRGARLVPADPDEPLVFETVVEQRGVPGLARFAFVRGDDGAVRELVGTMPTPVELRRRPALRGARSIAALTASTLAVGATAAVLRRRRP